MKKFSEFTNENKLETSKTKVDYITNLVEETLSIEDGVIKGKDNLINVLNKIIVMNEHKTTINVLENIKLMTYNGGFNFNTINNMIESEKLVIESINSNEEYEVVNESLEQIISDIALGIGIVSATGFIGSVGYLAGSGIYELLIKDSKLGVKGKEFVQKLKSLSNKARKKDKKEYANEVESVLTEYSDVIEELKSGNLGKDGEKLASNLEKLKEQTEKVEESVNLETEEMLNENFMEIIQNIALGIGIVSATGFIGSVGYLAGSGIYELLIKDSKLGVKGKEFVQKLKSLSNKARKEDKVVYAEEVDNFLSEYSDVIEELKSGNLGKDGEKLASNLEKIKEYSEQVSESIIYEGYKEQHSLEMESLKDIYKNIIKG